jgi:uncharacterized RDD family membrane protein YckC
MSPNEDQAETPRLLRRLAAISYDALLLGALLILADALVVVPLGLVWDVPAREVAVHPLFRLYLLGVILGFFCGFWLRGGQTLGMRAWRMRLIRADGGPLRPRDTFVRLAAATLSWAAAGLGFLWSLLDPQRLTWHDRLSKTRLVLVAKNRTPLRPGSPKA